MDPQTDLPDLVEDLEVNIDELASTLTPLLSPLAKISTTLPLLEKAKLHILAAYAIESLLFSALQASGADAKAHPLFAELARLKGYFAKIKDAEEHVGKEEKRARLDVGAAQRFIRHGLSGNERYDEMRKEREAREKERALEKVKAMTNIKFSEREGDTPGRKRGAEEVEGEGEGEEEGEGEGTPNKKSRVGGSEAELYTPATASKKHGKKAKQPEPESEEGASQQEVAEEAVDVDHPAQAKKKRGRPSRKDKAAALSTSAETATLPKTIETSTPARATRSSAPKTHSEAFNALAAGSPASTSKPKGKGKGRAK